MLHQRKCTRRLRRGEEGERVDLIWSKDRIVNFHFFSLVVKEKALKGTPWSVSFREWNSVCFFNTKFNIKIEIRPQKVEEYTWLGDIYTNLV